VVGRYPVLYLAVSHPETATESWVIGTSIKPRRLFHVDCDMFYVQVAKLMDPEGLGAEEYLIVGGSATGRGVVTSASYPCRALGVRSGMPTGKALRLCPQAVVAPVSRTECLERSNRVRDALKEWAPVVQAASIDEFYLDLTGTERLRGYGDLETLATRMRHDVLARSEISVSIGGATTRIVAKLATSLAKPAGVHVVPPGDESDFMRRFTLAEIPGIGPSLAKVLERRALRTVEDALPYTEKVLCAWLGDGRGRWLHRRIRGIDRSIVDAHEPRKSISSERTFFANIDSDEELTDRLFQQAISVAGQMRRAGLCARTVTVKLRSADFTNRTASHTVERPLESDTAVFQAGRALLLQLRRRWSGPVRLLGIGLSGLATPEGEAQLRLFQPEAGPDDERSRRVTAAVDALRAKFGKDAVLPGRIASKRKPEPDLDGRDR